MFVLDGLSAVTDPQHQHRGTEEEDDSKVKVMYPTD